MERRRGGAGRAASSSTKSGTAVGGIGLVSGGVGGAPNNSSCMGNCVSELGMLARVDGGEFESCDEALQNDRLKE